MRVNEDQPIINLDGVLNLRDVGGYPTLDGRRTRWRTLLRSACLDSLDEPGQAWLVRDAGVRTVIDLRDELEVTERPNVFAASTALRYQRVPLWDGPPPDNLVPDLRRGYRRELDRLGERMAGLIELVATPGTTPALVHCAAGKDRTGIVIALLLAAVGTHPEAIAADYALSQQCLGNDYLANTKKWVLSRGYNWADWEHTAGTPPERMQYTLQYLDEQHGGVHQYLRQHGVSQQTFDDLKLVLTE